MRYAVTALSLVFAIGAMLAPIELRAAREDGVNRGGASTTDAVDSIAQLIAQLGSDQYLVRNRAETRLIERGAEAFDQLQVALNHSDLEIAARAQYILYRIRIEWVRADDPVEVKLGMQQYGDLSPEERRGRIQKLARLDEDHGFGALCRIARYDPSPVLARRAALAVLGMPPVAGERSTRRREASSEELGASQRVPVNWIRAHLEEQSASTGSDNGWARLIAEETELLEHESEETNFDIVFGLLKYRLKQSVLVEGGDSSYVPLSQMVNLHLREGGDLQTALVFAFSWGMQHAEWDPLKQFEEDFADDISQDRLVMYVVAVAAGRKGDEQRAAEIAERAFQLATDDEDQRSDIADTIAELGRHDWAEREWRRLVDRQSAIESLYVRRSLATLCLHDRGENKKAAELLADSLKAIQNDPKLKGRFQTNEGRQWLGRFEAERQYFLACQAESQEDYQQQRKHLDAAIKDHSENPDVLIAMYRLKNADEDYHKSTVARILKSSKLLQNQILRNPEIPHFYNHWAWLISNTEGDFQQAVAFSHRSLELRPPDPQALGDLASYYYQMRSPELLPDSPSYLDTLGRCYYAAGDLENAIKYQRQAIEGHPHLMVMRRQLAQFESELADR